MSDCIFCRIVVGEIPANVVAESEHSIAFWDVQPRQPIHILVVPKQHHANIVELAFSDEDALVDLVQLGAKVAEQHSTGAFRFTFNTGVEAGQTVFHVHGHVTSNSPKVDSGN